MNHNILFSGGKDSLLTLHRLLAKGLKPVLYYFDTGSLATDKEVEAVKYYANVYGLDYQIGKISLRLVDAMVNGSNTNNHVPMRNATLFSFAVNQWYSDEPTTWYMGFPNFYPRPFLDGNPEYIDALNHIVGIYPHIRVKTVIGKIYPENVLTELLKTDMDISHLWLCDNYGDKMCGKCYKCVTTLGHTRKTDFQKIKHRYYEDTLPQLRKG